MPGRRTLLKRIAGTGALAPLAGCADRTEPEPGEPIALDEWAPDLPVAERVDVLTEGVESGIETELSDAATFEATLADAGIDVETLTRREDELRYERGLLHPEIEYEAQPPWLNEPIDPMDADGMVKIPQRPGLGYDIDWDYINEHRVD